MILTPKELESLVEVRHRSPHQLLGMHPMGDGKGIVVRTVQPEAKTIEVIPTHEKQKPRFALKKLHDSGIFEGSTAGAKN
ncbi:MAG TPA: 1,4-alpha-glucan branching enzyme, partial [Verrucomicrobiae bacterium]|nr:1,4-alpha-glucan branching enzyme [Verrucomicrobiae bacterium]